MIKKSFLRDMDSEIYDLICQEAQRQQDHIELIASENITSKAVLEAQGSILTNKYAEGYPNRRYYGGCEHVDRIEELAIERAKEIFKAEFVNVQPHSGSQANQAVLLALAKPGDTLLGMGLSAGGHLTHGAKPNLSGKWFNAVHYGVRKEDYLIDYDEVKKMADLHKPAIIIAGWSAYSRHVDFKRFREIADRSDALLLVDMAHFSGLVAAGHYPSPIPYADIVTTTTHKSLRGPRGGIILTNHPDYAKKINSAIFPGLQGGPLMHVIAGKAVAFGEILKPEFKTYIKTVIDSCRALSDQLISSGYDVITGGTDTHLILVDLRAKGLKGNHAEKILEAANITCNKNGIPFDSEKPMITSGLRLGTLAGVSRGFGVEEFKFIGVLIAELLDMMCLNDDVKLDASIQSVKQRVLELTARFPIYQD